MERHGKVLLGRCCTYCTCLSCLFPMPPPPSHPSPPASSWVPFIVPNKLQAGAVLNMLPDTTKNRKGGHCKAAEKNMEHVHHSTGIEWTVIDMQSGKSTRLWGILYSPSTVFLPSDRAYLDRSTAC